MNNFFDVEGEEELDLKEQVEILLAQIEASSEKDLGIIEETVRQTEALRKEVENALASQRQASESGYAVACISAQKHDHSRAVLGLSRQYDTTTRRNNAVLDLHEPYDMHACQRARPCRGLTARAGHR